MRPPDYRISYEPVSEPVTVVFNGVTVAESRRALRVRETRLPPVYYLPPQDVRLDLTEATDYHTHCPFKGNASYRSLRVGDRTAENAMWSYEEPLGEAEPIRGYIAFYPGRVDGIFAEGGEVRIDPAEEPASHGNPLVDWLLRDAWESTSSAELLARLSRQLVGAGVPVARTSLLVRTLHPQVMGAAQIWRRDTDDVEVIELPHGEAEEERFLASPFVPIFAGRGGVRQRLDTPDAKLDFPILRELAAEGFTDYAALPLAFSDGQIHALTLATDQAGGFDVEGLGWIHELLPMLSRLVEVHALRHRAQTLLDTYLGSHTGERVLEGRIRRGDGEVIPAVIWWADLRGSTELAERLPRQQYLELLNRFYEGTAGVVMAHGGEVLKFIGDAVLAIFPGADETGSAERALAAGREAAQRTQKLAAEQGPDGPAVGIALALHHGEVSYGNVGVAGRLDFTVTGPAVNQVARLEGVAKTTGRELVASDAFARLVPGELVSLGRFALRGLGEREVFGLS